MWRVAVHRHTSYTGVESASDLLGVMVSFALTRQFVLQSIGLERRVSQRRADGRDQGEWELATIQGCVYARVGRAAREGGRQECNQNLLCGGWERD